VGLHVSDYTSAQEVVARDGLDPKNPRMQLSDFMWQQTRTLEEWMATAR
jgi:hypothetical protein